MTNGLSQAEIDALLRGEEPPADDAAAAAAAVPESAAPPPAFPALEQLTSVEIDALGEIGNISMGTAATTLFALLSRRVDITTPQVSVTTMEELAKLYPIPFVAVEVSYKEGLQGTNVLFLRERDVKIITDLMMGGDGTDIPDELNDMHLSCISEVMNQMVGASSTSLSKMLGHTIDISPPNSTRVDLTSPVAFPFGDSKLPVVCTSFNMVVEGLIYSEIMQVTPVPFAKSMVEDLMKLRDSAEPLPAPPPPAPRREEPRPQAPAAYAPPPAPPPQTPPAAQHGPAYGQPPPGYGYPYSPPPGYGYPPPPARPEYPPVEVRPMNYGSFDDAAGAGILGENMDILLDVPLSVSVELGKSKKFIKEILDFNVGTIVVLDKMAGELVDVVVNGKLIAQGEVVVIDDSYGCRITEIISPSKRINPAK